VGKHETIDEFTKRWTHLVLCIVSAVFKIFPRGRLMGFFSSLFNFESPNRIIAKRAMDYCIGRSVSEDEMNLLSKFQLDKERFISARNALLVMTFKVFFMSCEERAANIPGSTVYLVNGLFRSRICELYDSLPEPEKLKMREVYVAAGTYINPEDSAKTLYLAASGDQFDSLSPTLQVELDEFVKGYTRGVAAFVKKSFPELFKN
jgi:hypothetical protein